MKTAAAFLAVSILLAALGFGGWHATHRSTPRPDPLLAEAQPASSAAPADAQFVIAPGQVRPKTRVLISSGVSLPIVELPCQQGERVTKGSTLARLDDADLRAALRAAEAKRAAAAAEIDVAGVRLAAQQSQIAASKVCLGEAQRHWGRNQTLIDSASVSQEAADEAHCKYQRLQAEHDVTVRGYEASQKSLLVLQQVLQATSAETERARLALGGATITSPIDGVVTRLNVHVGEVVTGTINNPGTVLMEVADMDRMLLVARVDEESIAKVKVGQKASVHLKGYGQEAFTGTVQSVALTSTEEKDGTRHFQTEIRLDTGGRVIPAGLSGEARLTCSADPQ